MAGRAAIEQLTSELVAATVSTDAPQAPVQAAATAGAPPRPAGRSSADIYRAELDAIEAFRRGGTPLVALGASPKRTDPEARRESASLVEPASPIATIPGPPRPAAPPPPSVRDSGPAPSQAKATSPATDEHSPRVERAGGEVRGPSAPPAGPPYRGAGLALRLLLSGMFVGPLWFISTVVVGLVGAFAFGDGVAEGFLGSGWFHASTVLAVAVVWSTARHGRFRASQRLMRWLILIFLGMGCVGAINRSTRVLSFSKGWTAGAADANPSLMALDGPDPEPTPAALKFDFDALEKEVGGTAPKDAPPPMSDAEIDALEQKYGIHATDPRDNASLTAEERRAYLRSFEAESVPVSGFDLDALAAESGVAPDNPFDLDAAVHEATSTDIHAADTLTAAQRAAKVRCDPSYPDVCIPRGPPDLDCKDIPQRRFRVLAPDPHHFDNNGDGVGCEK